MITAQGLEQLGFERHNDNGGDYRLMLKDGVVVITEWLSDKQQPSEAEIEAAHLEAKSIYDGQQYARQRKAEYPSVDELVIALWEGVVEERMAAVTKLEGKRQAVKTKYPK